MTEFTWKESFSVGIPEIDAQHKVLVDLIARLSRIEEASGDLREIMDKLDWYVHQHFTLEEAMMESANYPALLAHIAEHRNFESWLQSAQSHLATGGMDTNILAKAINDHLKDWLQHHILVVDMDYKNKLTG